MGNIVGMDTNELSRQIRNLIRRGRVMAMSYESTPPTCRLIVGEDEGDDDRLETNWVPFIAMRAGTTSEWNPPTIGEGAILFCPTGDPAQGVALVGINDEGNPPPSTNPNEHMRRYPDGASITYDHVEHTLSVSLPEGATLRIQAGATVEIETVDATVKASGSATVVSEGRVDVKASGAVALDSDASVTITAPSINLAGA